MTYALRLWGYTSAQPCFIMAGVWKEVRAWPKIDERLDFEVGCVRDSNLIT